ncbi:MAG: tRNA (adenosine(37)-N6)-threonylcarbamoyltransferase complex dimerization subunit type 1 TsaB [Clostridia bacterium]|nr:tRNA (adenosine(37)-N6)-threonylcarbamoyltransferase complex dimerization subunit type 1 TsaB [Clostridia bacterium]
MNYLAVDTSGKHLTVLISKDGKVYEFFDKDCGVFHSVKIMTEIENMLVRANMQLSSVDFFACTVGAGSFTGIRIGVSTVKALAFANKKPILRITSFDTLAYNKDSERVLAIIDAKHNGYYVCPYVNGVAGEAKYVLKDELIEYKDFTFVSSECLAGINTEVVSCVKGFIRAIEFKKAEITDDINSLTPLYVRKSQAEEGR